MIKRIASKHCWGREYLEKKICAAHLFAAFYLVVLGGIDDHISVDWPGDRVSDSLHHVQK